MIQELLINPISSAVKLFYNFKTYEEQSCFEKPLCLLRKKVGPSAITAIRLCSQLSLHMERKTHMKYFYTTLFGIYL